MNITFVSDAIYPYNKGGKEKRLYELSTRLSKLGHDVHIYTMHWWDSPERSRSEDGVELHAISKLYPLYNGDRRSIKEGLLFGFACLKLCRVQFEILDVDHMPFFPIYSAWLVCMLRHKTLYGTWHEALSRSEWTHYMGAAGNIAALVERVSVKLPYRITAASFHTEGLIQTQLHRTRRVSVVASGIDTKLMNKLKPADIRCDVLYVGRLVKDKNVAMLVRAIGIATTTDPGIRCVIIGHGVEKQNLVKLIAKQKLTKNITLLDPLADHQDIYRHMKAAKVFCLPSVREGFGIVALEALGCGTPVVTIASPANAAKDLIHEGINGSVVPLSASAIAEALQVWVGKPKPRGIAQQVAGYDWLSLAELQTKVYTT